MKVLETAYDSVPLGGARYIADIPPLLDGEEAKPAEVYLLAECTDEQFKEFDREQYPVKLGYFCKPDWKAGLPFYLFRCPSCRDFMVDYKHGHNPHLFCRSCVVKIYFSSWN